MRFTALQIELEQQKLGLSIIFNSMYDTILEIVKRNGGEVDLSDEGADGIYTVVYTDGKEGVETRITALRANEDGSIDYKCEYLGDEWYSLKYDEHEYIKALMSIADSIFQYIPEEDDRTE